MYGLDGEKTENEKKSYFERMSEMNLGSEKPKPIGNNKQ